MFFCWRSFGRQRLLGLSNLDKCPRRPLRNQSAFLHILLIDRIYHTLMFLILTWHWHDVLGILLELIFASVRRLLQSVGNMWYLWMTFAWDFLLLVVWIEDHLFSWLGFLLNIEQWIQVRPSDIQRVPILMEIVRPVRFWPTCGGALLGYNLIGVCFETCQLGDIWFADTLLWVEGIFHLLSVKRLQRRKLTLMTPLLIRPRFVPLQAKKQILIRIITRLLIKVLIIGILLQHVVCGLQI